MTERIKILSDSYTIHSYETDFRGRATLPALCNFMQESAWHHAENLGIGYSHLIKRDLVWVLSRMRVRITRYPDWGEKIRVDTWPSGQDKLLYHRDFRLTDEGGAELGSAVSTWIVIDLKRRRPQRLETHFDTDFLLTESQFTEKSRPIAEVDGSRSTDSFRAAFSDLDLNSHVNNVRYLAWIVDSFALDFHENYILRGLEIRYQAEATHGDSLEVVTAEDEQGTFRHSLLRRIDSKELCRARTVWKRAD